MHERDTKASDVVEKLARLSLGGVKANLGCVHRAQHAHCQAVWIFLLGRPYSQPPDTNGNRNLTFPTRFPSVTAPLGRTGWRLKSQGGISIWAHTPWSSGSFTKVGSKHKAEEILQQSAVPRRYALLSHTQRLKAGFSEPAPGCPGTSLSLAFICWRGLLNLADIELQSLSSHLLTAVYFLCFLPPARECHQFLTLSFLQVLFPGSSK